ncbi:MAG TPA: sugar phosphate nucleotidyltransferase [Erysipelothrix sp.]
MKTSLVIMAAGMGSRYGGLKQLDEMDQHHHILLDYSIYDAIQAGFDEVVFIIRKSFAKEFKASIGKRVSSKTATHYVFQENENIPIKSELLTNREKPLGTAHAIYCAKDVVKNPFLVINADDFYGKEAYKLMHSFLVNSQNENEYGLITYQCNKTLSDNGSVSRGVCSVDEAGNLASIIEKTQIERRNQQMMFYENDVWTKLSEETQVSMNFWGFKPNFFAYLEKALVAFITLELPKEPLKKECYLPSVCARLLDDTITVKVQNTKDNWYGITYQEDKAKVQEAIASLRRKGDYPEKLWDN